MSHSCMDQERIQEVEESVRNWLADRHHRRCCKLAMGIANGVMLTVSWILNWGPFPHATRPEWPPGTWEAAALDLQHLSSRQKGHRAPVGAPVSTVRETVLCVLDISLPSPRIQLSRTRIFIVGTSLNSHEFSHLDC